MKSYDSPGNHRLVIDLLHRKETELPFPICVYLSTSVVELNCYGLVTAGKRGMTFFVSVSGGWFDAAAPPILPMADLLQLVFFLP